MTTDPKIKAIEDRVKGATPGEWRYQIVEQGLEIRGLIDGSGYHFGDCDDLENGAFIAHSRTDIPYLLSRLSQLEKDNTACEARYQDLGAEMDKAMGEKDRVIAKMRPQVERLKYVSESMPEPKTGGWNWPMFIEECSKALSYDGKESNDG